MREIIILASSDSRAAAIGTLSFFAILTGFLIVVPVGTQICALCCSTTNSFTIAIRLLQYITLLSYFCGDNLEYAFDNYADGLPCGYRCIKNVRIATLILLGIAIILPYITNLLPEDATAWPKFVDAIFEYTCPSRCLRCIQNRLKGAKEENLKLKNHISYYSLSMFAILVKIDAFFTILSTTFASTDYCSHRNIILGWTFFGLFVIVGAPAVILTGAYAVYKLHEKNCIKKKQVVKWTMIPAVILLSISLPLYILADNKQPLDCAWGCDSLADNATAIAILRCNTTANASAKLCLMLVTLVLLFIALVSIGCHWFIKGVFEGTYLLIIPKENMQVFVEAHAMGTYIFHDINKLSSTLL